MQLNSAARLCSNVMSPTWLITSKLLTRIHIVRNKQGQGQETGQGQEAEDLGQEDCRKDLPAVDMYAVLSVHLFNRKLTNNSNIVINTGNKYNNNITTVMCHFLLHFCSCVKYSSTKYRRIS